MSDLYSLTSGGSSHEHPILSTAVFKGLRVRILTPMLFAVRAILFLAVSGILAFSSSAHAVLINDVDYTYVYDGSAEPSSSSSLIYPNPWTRPAASSGSSGTSTSGVFTLTTTAAQARYYLMTAGNFPSPNSSTPIPWNAELTNGSTVEFSVKVDSQAGSFAVASLTLTNGSRNFSFNLTDSGVVMGNSSSSGPLIPLDTTSGFNIYRLTLNGTGASAVFNAWLINNPADPVPLITNYVSSTSRTANRIYFGDPSLDIGGTTEWDYIAFTNAGAFPPVPEPGTATLFGLGLCFSLLVFRRRRLSAKRTT